MESPLRLPIIVDGSLAPQPTPLPQGGIQYTLTYRDRAVPHFPGVPRIRTPTSIIVDREPTADPTWYLLHAFCVPFARIHFCCHEHWQCGECTASGKSGYHLAAHAYYTHFASACAAYGVAAPTVMNPAYVHPNSRTRVTR